MKCVGLQWVMSSAFTLWTVSPNKVGLFRSYGVPATGSKLPVGIKSLSTGVMYDLYHCIGSRVATRNRQNNTKVLSKFEGAKQKSRPIYGLA